MFLVAVNKGNNISIYRTNAISSPFRTLVHHTGAVRMIRLLNNNNFASVGDDNKIVIWNSRDFSHICTIEDPDYGNKNGITVIDLITENRLVTADNENSIITWLAQSKIISAKVLNAHSAKINCMLSIERTRLLSGGNDSKIKNFFNL